MPKFNVGDCVRRSLPIVQNLRGVVVQVDGDLVRVVLDKAVRGVWWPQGYWERIPEAVGSTAWLEARALQHLIVRE